MQYQAHLIGQRAKARRSVAFALGLVQLDQVPGIAAGATEIGVKGFLIGIGQGGVDEAVIETHRRRAMTRRSHPHEAVP